LKQSTDEGIESKMLLPSFQGFSVGVCPDPVGERWTEETRARRRITEREDVML
jgi:hypothetical protein